MCPPTPRPGTQVLSPTENLPEPHTLEIFMEISSQIHDPSSTPPAAPPPSLEDWRGVSESSKLQTIAWPFWCPSPTNSHLIRTKDTPSPWKPQGTQQLGARNLGAETKHPNQDASSYLCRSGNHKGSRSSAAGAGPGRLTSHQHGVQPHRDGTGDKGHLDEEPA